MEAAALPEGALFTAIRNPASRSPTVTNIAGQASRRTCHDPGPGRMTADSTLRRRTGLIRWIGLVPGHRLEYGLCLGVREGKVSGLGHLALGI